MSVPDPLGAAPAGSPQPSTTTIAGVAAILLGAGPVAVGAHHVIGGAGGGALFVVLLIGGGALVLAGIGLVLGIVGVPSASRAPGAGASVDEVASVSGLGAESGSGRSRMVPALAVWIAALGAGVGIAALGNAHGDSTGPAGHAASVPVPSGATTAGITAPRTTPAARTTAAPPAGDITRGFPPGPSGAAVIGAGSRQSLFRRANLVPLLGRVAARLGAGADVVTFALYPGEADFVIANGGEARLVRVGVRGSFASGPTRGFSGTRSAVVVSQLRPGPLLRTLGVIAARGHVPVRRFARITLDTRAYGTLAGYRYVPASGAASFKSLLTGGRLERIGPGGPRPLH